MFKNLPKRFLFRLEKHLLLVIILLIGIGLGIVTIYGQQDNVNDAKNTDLFTVSELTYCSDLDDLNCLPSVMTLKTVTKTRDKDIALLYNYDVPKHFSIKIDEIKIKLNTKADDAITSELCIYIDDGDLLYSVDLDRKIVCSNNKKKTILFEGLNLVLESEELSDNFYVESTFYIVPSQPQDYGFATKIVEDEVVTESLLDSVEVKAQDLSENKRIENRSSFANLSIFKYEYLRLQSKAEFISNNSQFRDEGSNRISLKSDVSISKDLIIPDGLDVVVEKGVNILIDPGISVMSYSPVSFNGTEKEPITIKSSGAEPYGVFSVIGDSAWDQNKELVVRYLNVSNGSQDEINGAFMSGQINFYRVGRIIVENSRFEGAQADDGLNIKNSTVELRNNSFIKNSADALDGDFITGNIDGNTFNDNGNDALDFSGSDVVLTNNLVYNSGDKCVSVGEATKAVISRNLFDSCLIAVQVKDSSVATINENLIVNQRQVGLDSYVKKVFFGEPSTAFSDNIFLNNKDLVTGLVDNSQLENNAVQDKYKSVFTWSDYLWERSSNAGE